MVILIKKKPMPFDFVFVVQLVLRQTQALIKTNKKNVKNCILLDLNQCLCLSKGKLNTKNGHLVSFLYSTCLLRTTKNRQKWPN